MRHQCIIYKGSPSEHLRSIAITIATRLRANDRCLYMNSPTMVAGMRCTLLALDVDLDQETKRGALVLSSDQSHLHNGSFDVHKMMDLLQTSVQKSLDDGFAGLFASGDMTWEFGGQLNLSKLIEYELLLDDFMEKTDALSGICQYHVDLMPLGAADVALERHKAIYINDTLSQINKQYKAAG